jgi:hypothetical protein
MTISKQARQFYRIKFGDRYFFTHANQVSSFTLEQLAHIRSRKFSDIICDNSNLETVPVDVFKMTSAPGNEYEHKHCTYNVLCLR